METKGITLVSHGSFEKNFLEALAKDVQVIFGMPVLVEQFLHDIASYFDPTRKQYDANRLLQLVDSEYASEGFKTMGIFKVDLYIPILTFIFGQAHYRGNAGVASVFRLRNENYGMKGNDRLLFERFRKVIIHELGHTFGLIHCHVPVCVMRPGNYVEDIDQKKHLFCKKCSIELQAALLLNASNSTDQA
ncbi:archaemetzincin family Zn-dependent metalloprotease [Draconibacterium mangrovi]|uniref:archaemetzincin family Zn-dependent metalloprotease n=1 Tax=Draconibacterium mangrovi TaxID=2697469 RepID=UPI0013D4180D|nr:archaemetzincin family Zn-dependent metalloprotease [Draconibacterium mangrovi]